MLGSASLNGVLFKLVLKMCSSKQDYTVRFVFALVLLATTFQNLKCEDEPPADPVPIPLPTPHSESVERIRGKVCEQQKPALDIDGFEKCELAECQQICGTKDKAKAFCDSKNKKLCMCAMESFMSSNVEGIINAVNREDPRERNCSFACNIRNSYARVWSRSDQTRSCNCLLNQITSTGITLCDEFAIKDLCKTVCRSQRAVCAFNGICLCRGSWSDAFQMKLPSIRKEVSADKQECGNLCLEYSTEYVPRIYDSKLEDSEASKNYDFRDKYCLCGPEEKVQGAKTMADKLQEQGFQQCTGLKCKLRCGMNWEAQCEPTDRRACLCPRNNIFIGKFLWARLPSKKETLCQDACKKYGLTARVIEWNPFFKPENEKMNGVYRKSSFRYLYDGKFCHCISMKNEPDMNQFRPCTDELCQWIVCHIGAKCDMKTRRQCMCYTHQLISDLGRNLIQCNMVCRRNLQEARIFELNWDIPAPHWTVTKAKFCACIRPVTSSGLTHCDGLEGKDICPKVCDNPQAYCTKDKYCECFIQPNLLNNPMIRVPNGKEMEECGEICHSWTWPLAEDFDHQPFIYDESRRECVEKNNCPEVDTTPWALHQPGALQVQIDALEESPEDPKKYCLCAKTDDISNKPGIRFHVVMEPPRLSKTLPCISNYTCVAVAPSVHVIA
ncbi:hypothetical protein Ocin01_02636 [Orchesella cincta]|uniref:Uncharacterized protein n=1 Tax=Orchesella cincta TaxID=48709 RepID=A0A1D2NFX7_ORCCI|nr:hypothetical protein Ocin01_02636 [Orchesella cincta]